MIDPTFIAAHFPTLREMVHLDNASHGIPPVDALDAMTRYFTARMHGTDTFDDVLAMLEDTRACIAKLLGGTPANYAFVPNTTEGINTVANSISYPPGSNVVICDLEFPANYIPWQNLRRFHDVEVRVVPSEDGAVPVERFASCIDQRTRVVSVSHVQYGTGYRVDVKALARVAHEAGALLCLDVIQSAGVLDMNLVDLDVDLAAGQGTKWLAGPIGAGFVYVRDGLAPGLHPRHAGWWGVDGLEDFSFSQDRTFYNDARRLQVGSPAIICYAGLGAALKVLLQVAGTEREREAMALASRLKDRMEDVPGCAPRRFEGGGESPIVAVQVPRVEMVQRALLDRRIFCSVRDGRLRVSPHFYNTPGEIDTLVDAITEITRGTT